MFKTDLPITSRKQDKLGRAFFAERVAKAILEYEDKESLALGLYGTWGSGKTSIINMIVENIKESNSQSDTIICRFNPWNYSDQNQLISQFFKQLSSALGRRDKSEGFKNAAALLDAYAWLIAPLKYDPSLTTTVVIQKKICSWFSGSLKKIAQKYECNLEKIKYELNELLGKQNKKVVVVIDDIDRLNNTEIRQVFQLVKSLGDFQNTIYFLAFDMDVVCRALSKVQEGNGYDYLAKVVQLPFNIPPASKFEIHELLRSNLDEIIKDYPNDKFDQMYWQNIFHSGIKYFFNDIRSIKRFINIFRFKYYLLKDEINVIDLIVISVIEVFLPDLYIQIRDNKNLFVQTKIDYSHRVDQGATLKGAIDKIFHETVKNYPEEKAKNLLTELFPKLRSVYSNISYGSDWQSRWRKEGRICSEDIFDIFFQLNILSGQISMSEVESVIAKSDNIESFGKELDRLVQENKISEFLERMEDYTGNIPETNIQKIVSALMDKGDSFPEGNEGFLGFGNDMRILRIVYQLLKRIDSQDKRFEILKIAIETTENSIHTIEHEVAVEGQSHGKRTSKNETEPEDKRLINTSQLAILEKLVCSKIRSWAQKGKLLKQKNLFAILYSWQYWESEEAVKKFVNESIANDEGLVEFIAKTPHRIKSQGMGDYGYRTKYQINIKNVEHFVKLDKIIPRLRNIKSSNKFDCLQKENQSAIDLFLDTVDGKVEEL